MSECWFCGEQTDVLIAGYDEWDEQRLACHPCDSRLRKIAAHRLVIVHRDRESFRAAAEGAAAALDVERLARALRLLGLSHEGDKHSAEEVAEAIAVAYAAATTDEEGAER